MLSRPPECQSHGCGEIKTTCFTFRAIFFVKKNQNKTVTLVYRVHRCRCLCSRFPKKTKLISLRPGDIFSNREVRQLWSLMATPCMADTDDSSYTAFSVDLETGLHFGTLTIVGKIILLKSRWKVQLYVTMSNSSEVRSRPSRQFGFDSVSASKPSFRQAIVRLACMDTLYSHEVVAPTGSAKTKTNKKLF